MRLQACPPSQKKEHQSELSFKFLSRHRNLRLRESSNKDDVTNTLTDMYGPVINCCRSRCTFDLGAILCGHAGTKRRM
jgi:hypothetical protein